MAYDLGVIDVLIHSFGYDLAMQASILFLNSVSEKTYGLASFWLFPKFELKVAAAYGALRWSGLALSTVMTGILIKFGGAALAMLSSAIVSSPQATGSFYGQEASKGFAKTVTGDLVPTRSWLNVAAAAGVEQAYRGLTSSSTFKMGKEASGGNILRNYAGSDRAIVSDISKQTARLDVSKNIAGAETAKEFSDDKLLNAFMNELSYKFGHSLRYEDLQEAYKAGQLTPVSVGMTGNGFVISRIGDAETGRHLYVIQRGNQSFVLDSEGQLATVSGAPFGAHLTESLKKTYEERLSNVDTSIKSSLQEASKSFSSLITSGSGWTNAKALIGSHITSGSVSQTIENALRDTVNEILNRSTSIRDERGHETSREAFAKAELTPIKIKNN